MPTPDVYCNMTTDLQTEVALIDAFDGRRRVDGFQVVTGIIYQAQSVGHVSNLYRNEVSLGAAQATAAAVTVDGYWHYDATTDVLTIASTLDPVTYWSYMAGRDLVALKTEAVARASSLLRSLINGKPINRVAVANSPTGRTFPEIIVQCTAKIACSLLVKYSDPALARALMEEVTNQDETGWADRIATGRLALPSDPSAALQQGIVSTVSYNAASTWQIEDTTGKATVDHDFILVEIIAGGTMAAGTASPVTYRTKGKSDSGLQMEILQDTTEITGGWDYIGHGLYARFSPGVYTTGDKLQVEANGEQPEVGIGPRLTMIQMVRT